MNKLPSERVAVVGVIDPDAYSASTYKTAYVHVSKFRRLMAVVQAGDLVSSAVLSAKLRRGTDATGSNAEDISGAAIANLTQAGSDSNKQAVINYDTQGEEGNAKEYIGLEVTLADAGGDMSAILLGFDPMEAPASDNDLDSVDSITSKP